MNIKIWTPRYAYNRVRYYFFEKFNKDKPWITQDAIKELENLLEKDFIGLEFGSGRSSVWYAKRIKHLTSIEDHKGWYEEVNTQFKEAAISNVDYLFKNSEGSDPSQTDYCRVIDEFKDDSMDFIVVDGKHRDVLANEAIGKLKKGGILLLDDANRYLSHNTISPYSIKMNHQNMTPSWKRFQKEVENWKMIWTTNGVSDTAIFIKK